jgi:integrase
MKVELSERLLAGIVVPDGKRLEYTDTRCTGLRLRLSGRSRVWLYVYRDKASGRVGRMTLGKHPDMKLAEARLAADTARTSNAQMKSPRAAQVAERVEAKRAAITFDVLCDMYIDGYAKLNKRSWAGDVFNLKGLRAKFGTRISRDINKAELVDHIATRAITTPTQANRVHATLSKMLNWSVERALLETSPLAGVRKFAKEKSKDRVLSDDEIRALWQATEPLERNAVPVLSTEVALALRFVMLTACRPGEAAGARVAEFRGLDTDDAIWTIPAARAKNKRAHAVPLSGMAREIVARSLDASGRDGSEFMFASPLDPARPIERASLSQAVARLCARDRLAPFVPHDLRRTSATLAGMAGAPWPSLAALLNHTPPGITKVYDRADRLKEKREVVALIAARIAAITGPDAK